MSGSRARRALAVILLTGLAILAPATTAQASQFRYWTYWWGTGSAWRYASLGPSFDAPHLTDESVLGWRFGVTGPSGGGAEPPRQSGSYTALGCSKAPVSGSLRVALVVDFGTAADAPPGETRPLSNSVVVKCVVVPSGSNGAQVLEAAGISIRWRPSDGIACGLAGYPRTECAALVADPTPTPTHRPTPVKATVGAAPTRAATPSHSVVPAETTTPTPPAPTPTAASPSGTAAGVAVPEQTLPAAPAGALAATAQSSSGSPWPVAGVLLVLAALGGGTWWTRRRSM